jgi:hypothetical protein
MRLSGSLSRPLSRIRAEATVRAGSVFVCPRGLWHRQRARGSVTGFYATPRPSEISWADDPRAEA